jgi:hypothetical protein
MKRANRENLYYKLGKLLEEMPDFGGFQPLTTSDYLWLGRAYALVESGQNQTDAINFRILSDNLNGSLKNSNIQGIISILYRTLAIAELDAPAANQGAFIPVGSKFDVVLTLSKILERVEKHVLVIDPYMDAKVLTDYCVLIEEGVNIQLLTDRQSKKPSFVPAVNKWIDQYGVTRPLEVRYAPPKKLHDRSIILDSKDAWILTQSFNGLAERSPAVITKSLDEIAKEKIDAYLEIWNISSPIV